MPSITKTFLTAVAASGALASVDHQLMRREFMDALDNQLITRDEAEGLLDIWTRDTEDLEPIHVTRDLAEDDIASALIIRSDYDHLDDLYSQDLTARDLEIRSDIEMIFHDHEGLFARSLEGEEAFLRVRELEARDPELFNLYRRGVKTTSFLGALGGAALAGKGNRMKGFLAGGAVGFVGHKIADHIRSRKAKSHSKKAQRDLGDDGGNDYERRHFEDPDVEAW